MFFGYLGRLKWLAPIIVVSAGLLVALAFFAKEKSASVSGQVVSAGTKTPISNALVAVESTGFREDKAYGSYVRTDQNGRFVANTRGNKISIRVWKKGYAMNGVDTVQVGEEFTIELRELGLSPLPVNDDVYDLKPPAGFSFRLGEIVEATSNDADFVI